MTRNELLATYFYDHNYKYRIYACYDTIEDYDEQNVSCYDIYESSDGELWTIVNEGSPYYEMPSWGDIWSKYFYNKLKTEEK